MIVLDIETTGTDSLKHSSVSIGALDFFNPKNQFYQECRIWKGAKIDKEALKINGFSYLQVIKTNPYSNKETIENFVSWMDTVEDKTFAGQNIRFDIEFFIESIIKGNITYSLGGHKINRTSKLRSVDLHSVSYANHLIKSMQFPLKGGVSRLSLDKTLEYVGLPKEPNPHNALIGARMEAEAFSRLIYGKNLFQEFKNFKIPFYLKK